MRPLGRRACKAMAVRQALFAAGLEAFERQPIGSSIRTLLGEVARDS